MKKLYSELPGKAFWILAVFVITVAIAEVIEEVSDEFDIERFTIDFPKRCDNPGWPWVSAYQKWCIEMIQMIPWSFCQCKFANYKFA